MPSTFSLTSSTLNEYRNDNVTNVTKPYHVMLNLYLTINLTLNLNVNVTPTVHLNPNENVTPTVHLNPN